MKWDPARYGSLKHPGDNYSYDIFTQAAEVVRHPGAVKPLGALTPAHLIADGESQSAFRLVTYVDAIAPTNKTFDGFFIHSRSGGAAELVTAGTTANILGGPSLALIRGDSTVPVFLFETETDVLGIVGLTPFASARQPDTARLHTWEVAGTAHADQYLLDYGAQGMPGDAGTLGCTNVNSGPQHWVVDTALHAMNAWVTGGTPPPTGNPLHLADAGTGFAQDAQGNALGGVRTAAVDVPIATYSGQSASSNVLCSLFGSTTPLSSAAAPLALSDARRLRGQGHRGDIRGPAGGVHPRGGRSARRARSAGGGDSAVGSQPGTRRVTSPASACRRRIPGTRW